MANTNDSKQFVEKSNVHENNKREFAFTLKAHSDTSSKSLKRSKISDVIKSDATTNEAPTSNATYSSIKKFPSKLKDLLDSQVLNGFQVKYVRGVRVRKPADKVLCGVIQDNGILCYCDDCKGEKVISPSAFELHAGSANKRPAEHIFLDNRNSLRTIMNTFLNSTLDNMEQVVHDAVGDFTLKKSMFCLNCKDVNVVSRFFCISCEGTRHQDSSYKGMKHITCTNNNEEKLTRMDECLHKLIFQEHVLEDKTEVGYYDHGEKFLDGKINIEKSGILCGCCDKVVSPSMFEAHAGWASRRKPYMHIYTSNEESLYDLSISLMKDQGTSIFDNDECCGICHEPGYLLCCDGCPRTFHLDCVPLKSEPNRLWYCKYCSCRKVPQNDISAEHQENALEDGNIEEVNKGGCMLCREHDFTIEFGPRQILICDQCEKEYHIGCLKDNLEELPKGEWFCCSDCDDIQMNLQNLVARGEEPLSDSFLTLIQKKQEEKSLEIKLGHDIKWRILKWNLIDSNYYDNVEEIRSLYSQVLKIFQKQLNPIIDAETKKDFIPSMLYGTTINQEYSFEGIYCAVITVNQKVVCAGVFRVFGTEVAELPLVATKADSQKQGYFQSLFFCIENMLAYLNVKLLVLPAVHKTVSMWTDKFGFKELDRDEIKYYRRLYQIMIFEGTSLLHKPVPLPQKW